jgi:hypothetical protein
VVFLVGVVGGVVYFGVGGGGEEELGEDGELPVVVEGDAEVFEVWGVREYEFEGEESVRGLAVCVPGCGDWGEAELDDAVLDEFAVGGLEILEGVVEHEKSHVLGEIGPRYEGSGEADKPAELM